METKANYALIGAFVLLSMLAAVGFVAWLANTDFDRQVQRYNVLFEGPVRGLGEGGEVRFNGLRVGEVVQLSLDPDDPNAVIAEIEVIANTPVYTNSYARLEPQGLTGLSYIQIFAGGAPDGVTPGDFPLLTSVGQPPYSIPAEKDAISNLLTGGDTVLEQASFALARVNSTLSEDAIADFQSILSNIDTITGKLADAELDSEAISGAIDSVSRAADDIARTARTYDALAGDVQTVLRDDIQPLMARVETTLDGVDAVLASATGVTDEGELLLVDAREAINRLSNSGLTDLEETTDSLRQLVSTLNRIALQLERSPTDFFVGGERQTVEIPQ